MQDSGFQLKSWSHGWWVCAFVSSSPCLGFCLPLSLCPSPDGFLSLLKINKHIFFLIIWDPRLMSFLLHSVWSSPDSLPSNTPVLYCKPKTFERIIWARGVGRAFCFSFQDSSPSPTLIIVWEALSGHCSDPQSFSSASSKKSVEYSMQETADLPFPWSFSITFYYVVSWPNVGLELTTPRSRVRCSTDWANQESLLTFFMSILFLSFSHLYLLRPLLYF